MGSICFEKVFANLDTILTGKLRCTETGSTMFADNAVMNELLARNTKRIERMTMEFKEKICLGLE